MTPKKYLAVFLEKDGSVWTTIYVSTRETFLFLPKPLDISSLHDVENISPSFDTVTYKLVRMEGNCMIYRSSE